MQSIVFISVFKLVMTSKRLAASLLRTVYTSAGLLRQAARRRSCNFNCLQAVSFGHHAGQRNEEEQSNQPQRWSLPCATESRFGLAGMLLVTKTVSSSKLRTDLLAGAASPQLVRTASSSAAPGAANQIFQSLNALKLREELDVLSEQKLFIDYALLTEKAISTGAAKTESDAAALIDALNAAGVVMRYQDIVYLRPGEVATMLSQALPGADCKCCEKL